MDAVTDRSPGTKIEMRVPLLRACSTVGSRRICCGFRGRGQDNEEPNFTSKLLAVPSNT